jgi:hypothetical protein
VVDPISLEKYFLSRFRMGIKLFENFSECVTKFDKFLKKRGRCRIANVGIWYPDGSC